MADIQEREFWKAYMKAYEDCLGATSTDSSPWYVVPADDKENARLIVSQIVLETFDDLKMAYPKTNDERRRELLAIRRQLEAKGSSALAEGADGMSFLGTTGCAPRCA